VLRRAAVLGLALATACSSSEQRVAQRMARAEELVREQRTDEALLELESALVIDPHSAGVHERIGELLADRGAASAAAAHFGDAYQLDANRIEAGLRQAALLATEQPERAEQIMASALRSHPKEPAVHRTAATLALVRGDFERALASAREAIALDPTQRESWLQLGAALRARAAGLAARGEAADPSLEAALDAYSRADSLAGGDVTTRVETARTLASWPARRSEAAAAFRGAIALAEDRGDPAARHAAAAAFEQFARSRAEGPLVIEALRHEVSAAPNKLGAWERLAAASERAGGAGAGEAVMRELTEQSPDSPDAHIARSAWLAEHGRARDATAYLQQVIAGGLDDARVWEQLVRLDIALRQDGDAHAHQAELDAKHDGDPAARRSAARLALAEGRIDAAADALNEPAGRRADADSELVRAQVELARGDLAAARTAARRAAELAPGFSAPAQRVRAAVHAAAREWPEALAALDQIASRGLPLSADDRAIRAVAFAEREGADPDRARASLERAYRDAPAHFAVLEALTRMDLRAGRAEPALERIERTIADARPGARVLALRAEVLAELGQLPRAEADALRALEMAPELPGAVDLVIRIFSAEQRLDLAQRALAQAEAAGALNGGARALLAAIRAED
jgi:tetratricopeptide (TPR) repeat protein